MVWSGDLAGQPRSEIPRGWFSAGRLLNFFQGRPASFEENRDAAATLSTKKGLVDTRRSIGGLAAVILYCV